MARMKQASRAPTTVNRIATIAKPRVENEILQKWKASNKEKRKEANLLKQQMAVVKKCATNLVLNFDNNNGIPHEIAKDAAKCFLQSAYMLATTVCHGARLEFLQDVDLLGLLDS